MELSCLTMMVEQPSEEHRRGSLVASQLDDGTWNAALKDFFEAFE